MTVVKILQYPDPRLKTIAVTVTEFNDDLRQIVADMFETHYNTENCAALAATQLDFKRPKRITVIDYSDQKNQPLCLVNPEIIAREGEQYEAEGCKSVPGSVYDRVKRAAKIKVRALDENGKPLEFEAEGYFAKCIQHELDHLDGTLFIDRLSKLKRKLADKRVNKWHRLHGARR